jgi:hypothetical protein
MLDVRKINIVFWRNATTGLYCFVWQAWSWHVHFLSKPAYCLQWVAVYPCACQIWGLYSVNPIKNDFEFHVSTVLWAGPGQGVSSFVSVLPSAKRSAQSSGRHAKTVARARPWPSGMTQMSVVR